MLESFFKGKKQDAYGNEQLSSAYRVWRDYFSKCIEEYMPAKESYTLLHTASLVGLFTCIFVKSAHRGKIKEVHAVEVKTGMGGLHGNKVREEPATRFNTELTGTGRTRCPLSSRRLLSLLRKRTPGCWSGSCYE